MLVRSLKSVILLAVAGLAVFSILNIIPLASAGGEIWGVTVDTQGNMELWVHYLELYGTEIVYRIIPELPGNTLCVDDPSNCVVVFPYY